MSRAADTSVSNSLVRFHLATGDGPVGDVDVELFNSDKPVTVQNFLMYVRNGSYSNVLLNRLLPGVLLQGGGFTNHSAPASSNAFLEFGAVKNLGTITNEFRVGPQLSNVFGTLAMAKVTNSPNATNSASSQWFFNLGENSSTLDVQTGGYTVFGRVLPGTNESSGTNLLATFNSLSKSNGIIDMTWFYGDFWAPFTDLPVTYVGGSPPQNRQVYYVTVEELNPPAPDTNAPSVTVNFPAQDALITNGTITVTGTAADGQGIARVLYFYGDSTAKVANGTTNWSMTLNLSLGTNVVLVQAVDTFGNVSPTVTRVFRYGLPEIITSNTIVRFHFETGDRVLGEVNVELFDTDKPQTVRNFLLYVRNGSYSGVIAHRLAPKFVLQSGGYTNASPADDAPFNLYGEVPNLGMITNEFAVGRRMSNFFGTIAMAKLGNNANSASDEWFFNLANNSTNLDSQNGGFTVFGRVLTNDTAGTNLLASFNTYSKSNGIVDMTNFYGPTWSAFSELPVDYTNWALPRNKDLIYITVSEVNPLSPDTNPPSITVTSPPPDVTLTNANITLAGRAEDDRGLARVIYYFGDTEPRVAAGTTNWSAALVLRTGTNFVFVRSVDRFGNLSPLVELTYVLRITDTIALTNKGNGTISGITNGQELEVGQVYTVTAEAGRGAYFSGWSGTLSSSSNTLTFRMQTNMNLTATFKTVPLPKGQGKYAGLFIATNQPSQESSGLFGIAIRGNGHHSGNITYKRDGYVFSGNGDRNGAVSLQGTMAGQNVSMTLRLDVDEAPRRLAGVAFVGGSVSALEAYHVERRAKTNLLAPPGNYTFLISGNANAVTAPGGQGFGTMTMTAPGKISLNGTLGEGTPLVQKKAQLLGQDRWIVSSELYENGSIIGWSKFSTNETGQFSGNLYWFKPSNLADAYYPTGFTSSVQIRGAPFNPRATDQRGLDMTNGTVVIQGGNLPRPLTYRVTLDDSNHFTVLTGPTDLSLDIDPTTGRVTGSFFHPVTQQETALEGLIVQGIEEGGGLFYGPDQTGSFSITRQ